MKKIHIFIALILLSKIFCQYQLNHFEDGTLGVTYSGETRNICKQLFLK